MAAAMTHDGVAVEDAEGSWSYGELHDRARALGSALIEAGVAPGDVVAIALPPSRAAIAALLATHAAGAAFFFVDPARPPAATRELLDDLGVGIAIGAFDDLRAVAPDARGRAPLPPPPGPDDLAYAVASSGSTGKPKAVLVAHRGILPMLSAQIAAFGLAPGKRALLGTPLAFDASVSDIGTALVSGATLVIPPRRDDALGRFLAEARITHADLPPALLARLEPPAGLECAIVGGEVVPAEVLARWRARTRVVVAYGPTEATVCTSLALEPPAASIGRPLPHVRYRVVDGELWIGGACLALGYARRPELERARFVIDEGERWFRTGDVVVQQDDGSYRFVGRRDRQRKVGGRLVCPEEIEAALGDVEAAVVVRAIERPGWPARTAPVAFVVGDGDVATARLPLGMRPRIERVAALPRTPSGKPDLLRLETWRLSGATATGDPLCDAMARVLGAPVGPDDDFVALGGDSLAALELVAEAELAGVIVEVDAILAARTPRAILARARPVAVPTTVLEDAIAPAREALASIPAGVGAPSSADGFFTGATGFFGARLLAAWLARGPGRAVCLVRAASAAEAQARLRAVLPAHLHTRVEALPGDVSEPLLGLDAREHAALAARVATVVHGAARLEVTLPFEALAPVNLGLEVARLAKIGAKKRFHLVSTLAVLFAGDGCPTRVDEATQRAAVRALHGGYAASKWAAEALLDGAAAIHRLGLLPGGPDSSWDAFVRGLAALGAVPEGPHAALRFDLTPADRAAEAVAALLRRGDGPRVWHHHSPRGATLAELLAALRDEGVAVEVVAPDRFAARVRERRSIDGARALLSLSRRLRSEPRRADLDLFLLSEHRADRARSEAASGVAIPVADLRAAVRRALEPR